MANKLTTRQKLRAALIARGEEEVIGMTRRYDVFTRKDGGGYYYVGKSGALRTGATIRGSISASEKFKAALLGDRCTYPRCKCIVTTSTLAPEPACPLGLEGSK